MKMKIEVLLIVFLAVILLPSTLLISATTSTAVYNPWYDLDGDGKITIYDVVKVTGIYGSSGEPFTSLAALQYDSGWIDITDKTGKYFNITHNLNSTDIIVDIQGKTTLNGGAHQRNLGGTGYTQESNRAYGGADNDVAYSMVETVDGGYALVGYTLSFGAGGYYFWLVKIDSAGNMQWNQTYGGTHGDYAFSIVQTVDGGYALAGCTGSFGAGECDFWLVKTDALGNMQWNKTYGGTDQDAARSMVQTADGGYALAGYTYSFGNGICDFWLVKTNSTGHMEWNQTYGGTNYEHAYSVVETGDGGYALAGYTLSFGAGYCDFWLVKTDNDGNQLWNRTYGGTSGDYAWCVVQTGDGGYALAGSTSSSGAGDYDFWLVKTDANGQAQWNQTYGGTGRDVARSMVQTGDGGYALASETESFGAGGCDFWLVKTDGDGNMMWNQTYGGTGEDVARSMVQTGDGGYALAGYTLSFGAGGYDFWLVKTDSAGNMQWIRDWFRSGLAWMDSTVDTITLYRGATDAYWNYVRVRIWKIKDNP